jgi:hypothetical protein
MRKIFTLLFTAMAVGTALAQNNVGINTPSPDVSAALDISSTSKGLLIPRMTQSERNGISTPATGLMIFQTDNTPGFYYNGGTPASPSWQAVAGVSTVSSDVNIYGNGVAGALTVAAGNTLDWTTAAANNHAQFSSITINGTLLVPSGTKLRCSGAVTFGVAGKIQVSSTARTMKSTFGEKGIAYSMALPNDVTSGALGVPVSTIYSYINIPPFGGGSGASALVGDTNGGGGGGSFAIYAGGNITIPAGASVIANGQDAINNTTSSNGNGSGGGGGGLIVLLTKGTITIAGTLSANGGKGSNGLRPSGAGSTRGGGGGGGGGVICLVSPSTPFLAGNLTVAGGTGGAVSTTTGTSNAAGANGGASGGNGGIGGDPANSAGASAGAAGVSKIITTTNPENLY